MPSELYILSPDTILSVFVSSVSLSTFCLSHLSSSVAQCTVALPARGGQGQEHPQSETFPLLPPKWRKVKYRCVVYAPLSNALAPAWPQMKMSGYATVSLHVSSYLSLPVSDLSIFPFFGLSNFLFPACISVCLYQSAMSVCLSLPPL